MIPLTKHFCNNTDIEKRLVVARRDKEEEVRMFKKGNSRESSEMAQLSILIGVMVIQNYTCSKIA